MRGLDRRWVVVEPAASAATTSRRVTDAVARGRWGTAWPTRTKPTA